MRFRRVEEFPSEIVDFESILVFESKVKSMHLIGRGQPKRSSSRAQDFRCATGSNAFDLSECDLISGPRIGHQELKVFYLCAISTA
jgi:hypothetical protein